MQAATGHGDLGMLAEQRADLRQQGRGGGAGRVNGDDPRRLPRPGPQGQGGPAAEGARELFEDGRKALKPHAFSGFVTRELHYGDR